MDFKNAQEFVDFFTVGKYISIKVQDFTYDDDDPIDGPWIVEGVITSVWDGGTSHREYIMRTLDIFVSPINGAHDSVQIDYDLNAKEMTYFNEHETFCDVIVTTPLGSGPCTPRSSDRTDTSSGRM